MNANVLRIAGFVTFAAVVAVSSFVIVRELNDEPSTVAQGPTSSAAPGETSHDVIAPSPEPFESERAQPRFVGDALGIFIAPYGTAVPAKYQTYGDVCTVQFQDRSAAFEEAGELNLVPDLPAEFRLISESDNTGAVACGDTVYTSRREYEIQVPRGDFGSLIVGASTINHVEIDVAEWRVKKTTIRGREAVLIEPVIPEGSDSRSAVLFPERFGLSFVFGANMPLDDLMLAAERVAAATGE